MTTTEPTVTVEIENSYEDGYEFTKTVVVSAPPEDQTEDAMEGWWQDVVFPQTGGRTDGQGSLDAIYEATIIAWSDGRTSSLSYEWGG